MFQLSSTYPDSIRSHFENFSSKFLRRFSKIIKKPCLFQILALFLVPWWKFSKVSEIFPKKLRVFQKILLPKLSKLIRLKFNQPFWLWPFASGPKSPPISPICEKMYMWFFQLYGFRTSSGFSCWKPKSFVFWSYLALIQNKFSTFPKNQTQSFVTKVNVSDELLLF